MQIIQKRRSQWLLGIKELYLLFGEVSRQTMRRQVFYNKRRKKTQMYH